MRLGYGRVSTRDQNLNAQHDALTAAGCDPAHIYVEKISTRVQERPELANVRKVLRDGDTLVVTKIDRLGRSLLDIISIANSLREQGVTLEVLSGHFNRDDPMGEAFFQMTGVFAELERELIRQRTNEGLTAARARGRKGGRKTKLSGAQIASAKKLLEDPDSTYESVGKVFGVDRKTLYYAVNAEARERRDSRRRDRYAAAKDK